MVQGYAMYQGISPEEAKSWMLLGRPEAVAEQIERYLAVGVTHFIPQLNLFNRDVMPRFAAEVIPALPVRRSVAVDAKSDDAGAHKPPKLRCI